MKTSVFNLHKENDRGTVLYNASAVFILGYARRRQPVLSVYARVVVVVYPHITAGLSASRKER